MITTTRAKDTDIQKKIHKVKKKRFSISGFEERDRGKRESLKEKLGLTVFYIENWEVAKGYIFSHNSTFAKTYEMLKINEDVLVSLQPFKALFYKKNQEKIQNLSNKTAEAEKIGLDLNFFKRIVKGEEAVILEPLLNMKNAFPQLKKEIKDINTVEKMQEYLDVISINLESFLESVSKYLYIINNDTQNQSIKKVFSDYKTHKEEIVRSWEELESIVNSHTGGGAAKFSAAIKNFIGTFNFNSGWLLEPLMYTVIEALLPKLESFIRTDKKVDESIKLALVGKKGGIEDITLNAKGINVGINLKSTLSNRYHISRANRGIEDLVDEFPQLQTIVDKIKFGVINLTALLTFDWESFGIRSVLGIERQINNQLVQVMNILFLQELNSVMDSGGRGDAVSSLVIMTPNNVFWTKDIFHNMNEYYMKERDYKGRTVYYDSNLFSENELRNLYNYKRKIVKQKLKRNNSLGFTEGYNLLKQELLDRLHIYDSVGKNILQKQDLMFEIKLKK